mgnify:CR=1 FL=1
MAIALNHDTVADGTFSPDGATHWNAAHAWSGLGTNQLLYSTDGTTLAQSSSLTFNPSTTLFTTGTVEVTGTTVPAQAGIWRRTTNVLTLTGNNFQVMELSNQSVQFNGSTGLNWSTGNIPTGSDVYLTRTGTNQLGIGATSGGTNTGTLDCTLYKAGGTSGVATFGPAVVNSITVKGGIITAIS